MDINNPNNPNNPKKYSNLIIEVDEEAQEKYEYYIELKKYFKEINSTRLLLSNTKLKVKEEIKAIIFSKRKKSKYLELIQKFLYKGENNFLPIYQIRKDIDEELKDKKYLSFKNQANAIKNKNIIFPKKNNPRETKNISKNVEKVAISDTDFNLISNLIKEDSIIRDLNNFDSVIDIKNEIKNIPSNNNGQLNDLFFFATKDRKRKTKKIFLPTCTIIANLKDIQKRKITKKDSETLQRISGRFIISSSEFQEDVIFSPNRTREENTTSLENSDFINNNNPNNVNSNIETTIARKISDSSIEYLDDLVNSNSSDSSIEYLDNLENSNSVPKTSFPKPTTQKGTTTAIQEIYHNQTENINHNRYTNNLLNARGHSYQTTNSIN